MKKVLKSLLEIFSCYSAQCTGPCYCTHVFFVLLFFFPFKNIWCWVIDNLSSPSSLLLVSINKSFNFSINDKYVIFPLFLLCHLHLFFLLCHKHSDCVNPWYFFLLYFCVPNLKKATPDLCPTVVQLSFAVCWICFFKYTLQCASSIWF